MQRDEPGQSKTKRPGFPGLLKYLSALLDNLGYEIGARRGHEEACYRADIY